MVELRCNLWRGCDGRRAGDAGDTELRTVRTTVAETAWGKKNPAGPAVTVAELAAAAAEVFTVQEEAAHSTL